MPDTLPPAPPSTRTAPRPPLRLSCVVPAYNEASNLEAFLPALYETVRALSIECEIVLVNDGSKDTTDEVAQRLGQQLPLHYIQLARNFGKEAAMTAGHRKLSNLTVIVDRNRLQQGAPTEDTVALEPLANKWNAFGFDVVEIDGHDPQALIQALSHQGPRPLCVIASTVKGKGVSYMENQAGWHHGCPSPAQYEQALKELAA